MMIIEDLENLDNDQSDPVIHRIKSLEKKIDKFIDSQKKANWP